jgi:hypothetical protein
MLTSKLDQEEAFRKLLTRDERDEADGFYRNYGTYPAWYRWKLEGFRMGRVDASQAQR